jgi:hypothetical protein
MQAHLHNEAFKGKLPSAFSDTKYIVAKALKIEKDIFDMQQKMKETELALKKQGIAIKGQINQQPIVSRR